MQVSTPRLARPVTGQHGCAVVDQVETHTGYNALHGLVRNTGAAMNGLEEEAEAALAGSTWRDV